MRNVPDDWGCYYYKCELCGHKYHASEGGCCCTDGKTKCDGDHHGEGLGAYFDDDELTEVNGQHFCEDHVVCACCDEHHENLAFHAEVGALLCPTCWEDDHECG